jgi:hypothetical protein
MSKWDRRLTANSRAKDANVGNQAERPAERLALEVISHWRI